jgi:hypothetical protein
MGWIGSPETSVLNCRTPRNIPEDGRSHFNGGGNFMSPKGDVFLPSVYFQMILHFIDD